MANETLLKEIKTAHQASSRFGFVLVPNPRLGYVSPAAHEAAYYQDQLALT
jgi:hypothetical protein